MPHKEVKMPLPGCAQRPVPVGLPGGQAWWRWRRKERSPAPSWNYRPTATQSTGTSRVCRTSWPRLALTSRLARPDSPPRRLKRVGGPQRRTPCYLRRVGGHRTDIMRAEKKKLCIGTAASRLEKAGSADLADGWLQLVSRRLAYG